MYRESYLPSIKSLLIGLLSCFLLVVLLGSWLATDNLGTQFVQRFGLHGLFAGIFMIDSVPTPGGGIPIMALCIQGGISPLAVLAVCVAGTTTAGIVGYCLGHWMGMPERISSWIEKRYPNKLQALQERGIWGVAALAALPLPISFGTWSAGALKLPFAQSLFIAIIVRLPKALFYLWAIIGGFELLSV